MTSQALALAYWRVTADLLAVLSAAFEVKIENLRAAHQGMIEALKLHIPTTEQVLGPGQENAQVANKMAEEMEANMSFIKDSITDLMRLGFEEELQRTLKKQFLTL